MDASNRLTNTNMISLIVIAGIATIYFYNRKRKPIQPLIKQSIPELIDTLLVLIRAGHGPASAVSQLHNWLPDGLRQIFFDAHTELVAGQRFADVMKSLRNNLGPSVYPISDILVSADRDGLPITSVLDQLSFHAHHERRRQREVEAKELPVRLLFPLVCCILPSFVLLAMLPLLVNSLTVVSRQLR